MTGVLTYVVDQTTGRQVSRRSWSLEDMLELFSPDELEQLATGAEVTCERGHTYKLIQAQEQLELFGAES